MSVRFKRDAYKAEWGSNYGRDGFITLRPNAVSVVDRCVVVAVCFFDSGWHACCLSRGYDLPKLYERHSNPRDCVIEVRKLARFTDFDMNYIWTPQDQWWPMFTSWVTHAC